MTLVVPKLEGLVLSVTNMPMEADCRSASGKGGDNSALVALGLMQHIRPDGKACSLIILATFAEFESDLIRMGTGAERWSSPVPRANCGENNQN